MQTHFLSNTPESIQKVCELLQNGEVVALPTETVYGLAAHAFNEEAVHQIFKIKRRPLVDPLIIHVGDLEQINDIAEITPNARQLAEAFWPGPLTLILKKKSIVPDLVTAGSDTVAIRIPKHPSMRSILKQSKLPLAAPSANPFSYVSPTTAMHVFESLDIPSDRILDGGRCSEGLESTIVDTTVPNLLRLLRPGPIALSEIQNAVPGSRVEALRIQRKLNESAGEIAPGLLSKHYSPNTPIILFKELEEIKDQLEPESALVFLFSKDQKSCDFANCFYLSPTNNLEEAGMELFATMRALDQDSFKNIFAQMAPELGLGITINDRLKRAAARR